MVINVVMVYLKDYLNLIVQKIYVLKNIKNVIEF